MIRENQIKAEYQLITLEPVVQLFCAQKGIQTRGMNIKNGVSHRGLK